MPGRSPVQSLGSSYPVAASKEISKQSRQLLLQLLQALLLLVTDSKQPFLQLLLLLVHLHLLVR
jgi:hypothetical protein